MKMNNNTVNQHYIELRNTFRKLSLSLENS